VTGSSGDRVGLGRIDIFARVEHVDGGRGREYMKVTPIGGKSGFDGAGAVSGVAQGYTRDRGSHAPLRGWLAPIAASNHFTIKLCRSPGSRQRASICRSARRLPGVAPAESPRCPSRCPPRVVAGRQLARYSVIWFGALTRSTSRPLPCLSPPRFQAHAPGVGHQRGDVLRLVVEHVGEVRGDSRSG